ncbi:cell differentiation protein, putative [Bodo saltans]|uniref:Cell differentiation protein, putative n=1 Tax=Bodo saltans TaxID=75058 RepID=A0A0S4ITM9_BODSA|nr:cell differentiation protein, putative [Bodo saltans]|eukprot:CUF10747.1 cell differentiation protein, putative [Bodo saltans]
MFQPQYYHPQMAFPPQQNANGAIFYASPIAQGAPPMNGNLAAVPPKLDENTQKIHHYMVQLLSPDTRENAIAELAKFRDTYGDLGPLLWYSVGTIAVLLQEIISVYPLLSHPAALQVQASNRVSNALALLQCVASHQDTRKAFLDAQMCLFLYPFLSISSSDRPYEYLRLTSLGVIGALVKSDDGDVIKYLLGTEIVPLCLKIMEKGSELSKTVATFVVQKILLSDQGLHYICLTPERFTAVATVLRTMVCNDCSPRLLRHIIRCFLRLSDHSRARDALKRCLPDELRNGTFAKIVSEDNNMKKWLFQLLINIDDEGARKMQVELQMTATTPSS